MEDGFIKYARAEKEVEIQPVIVNVQNIIINKIDLPFNSFRY
jgi:hypothetical protein